MNYFYTLETINPTLSRPNSCKTGQYSDFSAANNISKLKLMSMLTAYCLLLFSGPD